MEIELVKLWETNKHKLEDYFKTTNCREFDDYKSIISKIFELCFNDFKGDGFDIEAITQIDNGHYQGTLLFMIPLKGYQPDEDQYYWTAVGYGSCSGCDTLQAISLYTEEIPSEDQVSKCMTLALHLVQKIKKLN